MATTEGVGPRFVPVGPAPTRSSAPSARSERGQSALAEPIPKPQHLGDLPALFETRRRALAQAVETRQLDRTLGGLSATTSQVKARLEEVKLYPPYPVNESRRAEAIREFNGLAAEARRLAVAFGAPRQSLDALAPNASTAEAEQAISGLTVVGQNVAARRAKLAATAEAPKGAGAETQSIQIGSALGHGDFAGLTRQAGELLRQIG